MTVADHPSTIALAEDIVHRTKLSVAASKLFKGTSGKAPGVPATYG